MTKTAQATELIARLDACMEVEDLCGRCNAVKDALEDLIRKGSELLADEHMQPAAHCYARRLVHKDPDLRYTVMAMVWGEGQGTALHDHAGMWCVECVYKGRIRVVSYDLRSSEDAELIQFSPEKEIFAGVGEAGALIPPFDYHTIENADAEPSVTIHVYGGEMTWCDAFVPTEGGYRKERRELRYTE
ncbi:MAG TPA: cysteine dioxygenase family protein [Fimbriimonadaceae bacterium]|nr:cysteine dioxygenase family protein [Fimbriimonadaceae bacterium]